MIELSVEAIGAISIDYRRVVVLKEKVRDRYLAMWIGPAEAEAILVKLQDIAVPRPLTHDLLTTVIAALGASVDFVVVTDLRDDTFYAKVVLNADGKEIEIESRPCDALALAVRANAPIRANEWVLDKAGIVLDGMIDETAAASATPGSEAAAGERRKVDEAEINRMSAFHDVIDALDLEGFDKRK